MRLKELKQRGQNADLKYILCYQDAGKCKRWISARGWVLERDGPRVVYRSPMGGQTEVHTALIFNTNKQSRHVATLLNSEIVYFHEPDLWYGGVWYDAYLESHPKQKKELLRILHLLRDCCLKTIALKNMQAWRSYNSGERLLLNRLAPQDLYLLLRLSQNPTIFPEESFRNHLEITLKYKIKPHLMENQKTDICVAADPRCDLQHLAFNLGVAMGAFLKFAEQKKNHRAAKPRYSQNTQTDSVTALGVE